MNIIRQGLHAVGLTNEARFRKYIERDRSSHASEYTFPETILREFHEQGGLSQYIQPYKLVSLYRILERERPKSILELGTGSSSIVFAKYANNYHACVDHVDESTHWLSNTQANIVGMVGKSYNNSRYYVAKKECDLLSEPVEFWYDFEITRAYDMIFIDGPALVVDGVNYKMAICTDILKMHQEFLPKLIVVDIRYPTVEAISKEFQLEYQSDISDILARRPRPGFRYFSEFRKSTRT